MLQTRFHIESKHICECLLMSIKKFISTLRFKRLRFISTFDVQKWIYCKMQQYATKLDLFKKNNDFLTFAKFKGIRNLPT